MGNVTTPIKAALAAYISHALVTKLGMDDQHAGAVADAAWMLLAAGITYAVPADFGGKWTGAAVSWLLARVLKVAPVLLLAAVVGSSLVGCSAQQGASGPRDLSADCHIAEVAFGGVVPLLSAKCAQAKDPAKDGYCLGLIGGNTAIATCYAAAARGSAADVQKSVEEAKAIPAQ